MSLKEIEAQIARLSPAEKAQVLHVVANELIHAWPGIEKTPGVLGGNACIARTRIAVWMLEGYRRLGWSDAYLLESYPALRQADLANAWAYVAAHPDEIEGDIRANEEDGV